MKKLLFILFAILSIGISQKASAYDFSAVNSDGDTIYYRFISGSDSTVQVTYEGTVGNFHGMPTYSGKNYAGDLIIPPTVTHNEKKYTVSIIGWYSFWRCYDLLSITLPETITLIAGEAFVFCRNLRTINFPTNSATKMDIGYRAFDECNNLEYLNIPNSVTYIGDEAFLYTGLKMVILGNSVSYIGYLAFPSYYYISYSIVPPIAGQYPLGTSDSFVLVPCESVEAYKSAPNWDIYDYSSCIGLEEIRKENLDIIVYPNPANNNITIKANQLNGGYLFLYDIMGKEVLRKTISGDETFLDISNLKSGIYVLKVLSKDNSIVENRKIIKH